MFRDLLTVKLESPPVDKFDQTPCVDMLLVIINFAVIYQSSTTLVIYLDNKKLICFIIKHDYNLTQ